ncbi:DEHA2B06182p [Debaryomyces hansenii CBS767]|uniref:DEHA2B06182p n=1 Tax=Debaryomyces hansenii (strain ATCC 36239 / CBS 767 / BCRC 21394 / JCM 1990 / NBRC 0083 / IGC 2968) TaxID=284592 RepID=Q6BX40_DEBHA|nr:DEHA2B06182p [Debaryomyces hansenii CBS767]CAG85226.1 DEHA2B06182p [Debaryomyces hansenii CBS767]|eukprot:XP_457229.1 DEHA2B06182p [Debaryomyces hansenii CBS767]
MVKLTQIDDESATRFDQGPAATHAAKEETFSDSEASDSDSDIDDDFDFENETLLDRIVALKDVIPPQHRTQIVSAGETIKDTLYSGFSKSGNLLWTLTSSALLLGVPLSLAILAETQLQEMEKEMSLQQSAQDVLAPGSEEAFKSTEKPATA